MTHGRAVAMTNVGFGRARNEDCHARASLGVDAARATLCIVSDGTGGIENGEEASRIAVESARGFVLQHCGAGSDYEILGRLKAAVMVSHEAIRARSSDLFGEPDREGAARAACVICEDMLYSVAVVDSAAYRSSNVGLDTLFIPDRYLERGSVLSQALGATQDIRVKYDRRPLASDDLVLLCTDGLSDVLRPQDIWFLLQTGSGLDANVAQLVSRAMTPRSVDNITVILWGRQSRMGRNNLHGRAGREATVPARPGGKGQPR